MSQVQIKEIRRFWDDIWAELSNFNPNHRALSAWKREKGRQVGKGPEGDEWRKEESWKVAVGKMQSWKAPGPDGIPGFWYRSLPSVASALKQKLVDILEQRIEVPAWFVRGRTILIPKTGCTGEPCQYWPIACLNTAYKLLTA